MIRPGIRARSEAIARSFGVSVGRIYRRISNHLPAVVVSIVLATIFTRSWINASAMPGGTDALQYASTAMLLSSNYRFLYLWQSFGFGGQWLIGFANLASIFVSITNDPIFTVKLLFYGCISLSYLGAYFLCFKLSSDRFAALVASLVYASSQPFVRILSTGGLNMAFAYALAPISVLLLVLAISTGSWKWALNHAAANTLIVIARPDFLLYWIPLQLIVGIGTAISTHKTMRNAAARILRVSVLSIGSFIGFTAFEWLPLLVGPIPRYLQTSSLSNSFQGQNILAAVLNLTSPAGYMAGYLGSNPQYTLASISLTLYIGAAAMIPILAFSALWFKRDGITISVVSATLVGIFLAKGSQPPFGEINLWIFTKVWPLTLLYDTPRWLMPVALGYSVLISFAIPNILRRTFRLASALPNGIPNEPKGPAFKKLSLHLNYGHATKVFIILGITLTCLVLTPVPWTTSLCTVSPYREYVDPYIWLATQPDRGLIFPVPYSNVYSNGQWLGSSCGGWHNDLGFVSALWTGHAPLYPGGPPSTEIRYTTDFLGQYVGGLILNNGTSNIGSILGPVGVGSFVVNGYPPTESGLPGDLGQRVGLSPFYQQEFFSHQRDIVPVYVKGNSTVYNNPHWNPIIYRSGDPFAVVGGADTMGYMASLGVDISSHPLFFLGQDPAGFNSNVPEIIFADSSLLDLVMDLNAPSVSLDLSSGRGLGFRTLTDPLSVQPYNAGYYERTGLPMIYANGHSQIENPFQVSQAGKYELWVHVILSPEGTILAKLDDSLQTITPLSGHLQSSPTWVRLISGFLAEGHHTLWLNINSTGADPFVALDAAYIFPQGNVDALMSSLSARLSRAGYHTDFLIGPPALMKTISRADSVELSRVPYDSSGGFAVFSDFGGSGTLELSGTSSSQYHVLARVAPGVRNGVISVKSAGSVLTTSLNGTGSTNVADLTNKTLANLNPGFVTIKTLLSSEGPPSQLVISTQAQRPAYSLVRLDYDRGANWSSGRYVSMSGKVAFKSDIVQVYFYFGPERKAYAEYDMPVSDHWSTSQFDKLNPHSSLGDVNWSDVTRVIIATVDKSLGETVYLAPQITSFDQLAPADFRWVDLGHTYFDHSNVTIDVQGELWVDQIVFVDDNSGLASLLNQRNADSHVLDWIQTEPNTFLVNVNESRPFSLMFQQTFDARWIARMGSVSVRPALTDRFMISYQLPPGRYQLSLHFDGDQVQWIGYGISVGLVSIALAVSLVQKRAGFPRGRKSRPSLIHS